MKVGISNEVNNTYSLETALADAVGLALVFTGEMINGQSHGHEAKGR
jgi:hypothetical protein